MRTRAGVGSLDFAEVRENRLPVGGELVHRADESILDLILRQVWGHTLEAEYAEMEQQHEVTYAEFQKIRAESQQLWQIKSHIDTARKAMGYSLEHQPKKQEQEI